MTIANIVETFLFLIVLKIKVRVSGNTPYLFLVLCITFYALLELEVFLQQQVNLGRKTLEFAEFCFTDRCRPVLYEVVHSPCLFRVCLFLLGNSTHGKHVLVGKKEMINLIYASLHSVLCEMNLMRCFLPPGIGYQCHFAIFTLLSCIKLIFVVYLQPSPNHGIAHRQPVGKEWGLHIFMYDIEPKR